MFFMKKIALLLLTIIFLTACDTKSPDTNSNAKNSNALTKEFLKTDSSKEQEYNAAIKTYNEFLSGEADAINKDNNDTFDINTVLDDKSGLDHINYAIFDLTGDGIPELLTFSGQYYIYSYQNGSVVFWLAAGNNLHGPVDFLENGAIFCTLNTTGIFYRYMTFDSDGNLSEINFASPPASDNGVEYPYYFNNKEVSENEWADLTKEYFSLAKKIVSIAWQPY